MAIDELSIAYKKYLEDFRTYESECKQYTNVIRNKSIQILGCENDDVKISYRQNGFEFPPYYFFDMSWRIFLPAGRQRQPQMELNFEVFIRKENDAWLLKVEDYDETNDLENCLNLLFKEVKAQFESNLNDYLNPKRGRRKIGSFRTVGVEEPKTAK